MYTILMKSNKTLVATSTSTLYQKDNAVDKIKFLVPKEYNNYDLSKFTVTLQWSDQSGTTNTSTLTLEDELYNDTYLVYIYSVDTDFTTYVGVNDLQLTFEYTGKESDIIMYDYTVSFDANGGEGTMSDEYFDADVAKALTANAFTYTGYTFVGWNTTSTATTALYTDEEVITPTADMTLYAIWSANPEYTVTFDDGDGNQTTQTITSGVSTALDANTFTKDGYTFLGWDTDSSADQIVYTDGESITVDADITLYAVWFADDGVTHEVTFTNDTDTSTQTVHEGIGEKLTANSFTEEGYAFAGWDTDSGASTVVYTDEEYVSLTDDLILYAVWTVEETSTEEESDTTEEDDTEEDISFVMHTGTIPVFINRFRS